MKENIMRETKIEKIVVSTAGIADKLDNSFKLLGIITGRKPYKTKSRKRIPGFGVRPGLEVGCQVTIRENIQEVLERFLSAVDNQLKKKQIEDNHFSFGISEYIEIPGIDYQRDIGMLGLNVTVVFVRKGKRICRRKIKRSKSGKKQIITKEEIIKFLNKNYKVEIE